MLTLKPFQEYVYELNKVYEYRVKIAGINPQGQVMERIKNALDAFEVESVSNPKSLPIQEHRDFPKMGPTECWTFEVAVKYPTTVWQIRQLIKERAAINPDCICVYTKHEHEFTEEAEARGQDHEGALLEEPELKADEGGQELAGQKRVDSLLKELTARTYEFEQDSKESGKTTNTVPVGTDSPVGSKQNKITDPMKGQK